MDRTEVVALVEREVGLKGRGLRDEQKGRRKFGGHFFRILGAKRDGESRHRYAND